MKECQPGTEEIGSGNDLAGSMANLKISSANASRITTTWVNGYVGFEHQGILYLRSMEERSDPKVIFQSKVSKRMRRHTL